MRLKTRCESSDNGYKYVRWKSPACVRRGVPCCCLQSGVLRRDSANARLADSCERMGETLIQTSHQVSIPTKNMHALCANPARTKCVCKPCWCHIFIRHCAYACTLLNESHRQTPRITEFSKAEYCSWRLISDIVCDCGLSIMHSS
jgi:hypothetical protein